MKGNIFSKFYCLMDIALVLRNWYIGKRIYEEELQGNRANYGNEIIKKLSKELTKEYGKAFDYSSLYKFTKFYKMYPNILDSVSPKSSLLSWTHYRVLLNVEDNIARSWYEKEAIHESWSVRTLHRNISSQYYYRLLQSKSKIQLLKK